MNKLLMINLAALAALLSGAPATASELPTLEIHKGTAFSAFSAAAIHVSGYGDLGYQLKLRNGYFLGRNVALLLEVDNGGWLGGPSWYGGGAGIGYYAGEEGLRPYVGALVIAESITLPEFGQYTYGGFEVPAGVLLPLNAPSTSASGPT